MLLRFGVANFFSVSEYTEVNLSAVKGIKDAGADLIPIPLNSQAALPVVLIYGANAAGKTTAWLALKNIRDHVISSFKELDPDEDVPNTPFVLDADTQETPSRFDCDFVADDIRYHYGFEIYEDKFSAEWLYYFPEGSRRVLFERNGSLDKTVFGASLKGQKKNLLSICRENSLIVSAAASINHEQLSIVQKFFRSQTAFIGPSVNSNEATPPGAAEVDTKIVEFLRLADTGVVSAKIEYEEPPEEAIRAMETFRRAMMPVAETVGAEIEPVPSRIPRVYLGHRSSDGSVVDIPLGAESRGTIRLVSLMRRVFAALESDRLLAIDELDSSLHPSITRAIVRLFASKDTNPNGAQLFATTHDTNLLSQSNLRRDQIWFAEKSAKGSTVFYPLTDIRTRNTDNIEKGYLQGRFGAIPFIGDLRNLLSEDH